MLADYVRFVAKLADFEAKMSTLEKDLNDDEDIYFMEVMHRCNLKMLKALD